MNEFSIVVHIEFLKMSKFKKYFQYQVALVFATFFSSVNCLQNVTNRRMNVEVKNYLVDQPNIPLIFTTIGRDDKHIYRYTFNNSFLEQYPAFQLQFYAEADISNSSDLPQTSYPLLVTGFWHGSVRSWEIPIHFPNDTHDTRRYSEKLFGKILWHYPLDKLFDSWNLTVHVTFVDDFLVYYKMKIIMLTDFLVEQGAKVTGIATPASPSVFMFQISPTTETASEFLFIEVTSNTDVCARVSVKEFQGPFLDQLETHDRLDLQETFTLKTGLTLKRNRFPGGFLLVFNPFSNDKKCMELKDESAYLSDNLFRKKYIEFVIREGMSISAYALPLFLPVFVMGIFGLVTIIIQSHFHTISAMLLAGVEQLPPIVRKYSKYKSQITINDLMIEEPTRVVIQSQRYCRGALVSTAFYCIPVFQLITTFSNRLLETGDFDICYFNHYCSHMLGPYNDFNHMYSNIGYIIFGVLYGFLVRSRQMSKFKHRERVAPTQNAEEPQSGFRLPFEWCPAAPRAPNDHDKGVCVHYSLLYCLAFTLIMTGVMSAGYHICPNQNNFQFDTVFMYTIAAITVVNIYQFRHPTYLSANFTFASLALVACITVLGLLWEQLLVRICFTVIHSAFLLSSLPKICFNGYIRRNGHLVHHWQEMMYILLIKLKDDVYKRRLFKFQYVEWRAPHDPEISILPGHGRLILPGFFVFINTLAMLAIWTALKKQNFATQVLFVCVINGSMYSLFYSFLKWHHGECRRNLWVQPFFYIISSLILWATAMYYFLDVVSTWENSPAKSRLQNKECIVLEFYDSHDMWHFFSSAALFTSAMVLLTVDDDLVDQPKSTIPVF